MLALIRGRIVTLWIKQAKFFRGFWTHATALETVINAINALEIDGLKQFMKPFSWWIPLGANEATRGGYLSVLTKPQRGGNR